MHALRRSFPARVFVAAALIVTTGCGALDLTGLGLFGSHADGLSATTVLTSSSLSASDAAALTRTVIDGPGGLRITPDNVNGQVLSLLFAIDGRADEGIVVFGNERPDIAPSNADLQDFDLARQLSIDSRISLPPGFQGGPSSMLVMLFGYMDFEFTLGGTTRTVRVALADIAPMQRGDVLLRSADAPTTTQPSNDPPAQTVAATAGKGFQWLDLDTNEFTSERPVHPALIEPVRDFTDPIRRDLAFYPINVALSDPVQITATDLLDAESVTVVIDFELSQSVTIVDRHFERLSDRELIAAFNLSQIATGFGDSGFQANASLEYTGLPTPPGPAPDPQIEIFDLRGGIPGTPGNNGSPIGIAPLPSP